MIADMPTITVPIKVWKDGSIRVGETLVLLELVVDAYDRGETVDGIVDMYSTLESRDVYAVIAYYLTNKKVVRKYIETRDKQADELERYFEERMTPEHEALLDRLRAIRLNREAAHGSVSLG